MYILGNSKLNSKLTRNGRFFLIQKYQDLQRIFKLTQNSYVKFNFSPFFYLH
jgi:hypothetical protein